MEFLKFVKLAHFTNMHANETSHLKNVLCEKSNTKIFHVLEYISFLILRFKMNFWLVLYEILNLISIVRTFCSLGWQLNRIDSRNLLAETLSAVVQT